MTERLLVLIGAALVAAGLVLNYAGPPVALMVAGVSLVIGQAWVRPRQGGVVTPPRRKQDRPA